jgi:RHS repeat-associated protein
MLASYSVLDHQGTTFTFSNSDIDYPNEIQDRNGNTIYPTLSNLPTTLTFPDTAGRIGFSISGTSGAGTYDTVVAGSLTYKVYWRSTSPSYSVSGSSEFSSAACMVQGPFSVSIPNSVITSPSLTVVSSIVLPNQQQYTFYYGDNNPDPSLANPYGLLSEIIYPDGGWVKYTYRMSDSPSIGGLFTGWESTENGLKQVPNACAYVYPNPVVATRTVSYDGTHVAQQQSFTSYSTSSFGSCCGGLFGWTSKTTTVSTTDEISNETLQTIYSYTPVSLPHPPFVGDSIGLQIPVESQVSTSNWGNTANLQTITKTWLDQFNMTEETTTLGTVTSTTVYSPGSLFPQEIDEYGYGASTPTRKTLITYQPISSPGTITVPCTTIVQDGSGHKYAETDDYYDSGTALCGTDSAGAAAGSVSGLPANTHDETLYGPSSSTPRGNVTQEIRWSNSGTSPTTTYAYDETGQVTSVTDPCGNSTCTDMPGAGSAYTTAYIYSDNPVGGNAAGNSNAYLTQIKYPTVNGVQAKNSFSYNYATGQLASATDENSQITNYSYNDPLLRLKQASYPDGGQTEYAYSDVAPSPSVTTCRLINATAGATCSSASPPAGWRTSLNTMDGMGHTVQTELVSDPGGPTYISTTYNGLGQVSTATNPYRSTSDTTYGSTAYTYDSIGRTTNVGEPDGSSIQTVYNQACTVNNTAQLGTTITDEVGNRRQLCQDGLGRLTGVTEAPNTYSYQTTYTYDPLNDLTSVTQNGSNSSSARVRSFVYDSLSRLTSATNPESGTIAYSYDANNNLSSKIAPEPNQTSGTATVTINYSYDALNRLTQKAYGGTTLQYGYDGTSLTGCGQTPSSITSPTYLVGRRSSMCSGMSASSWSYDPMGRPLLESRANLGTTEVEKCTGTGKYRLCGLIAEPITTTLNVGYTYNLDGSMNTLTYPSGDVVTYTPGGAGLPLGVSDASNIYVEPTATYAPNGALTFMMYSGENPGLNTTTIYNNRFQPTLLSAWPEYFVHQEAATIILNLCYDFHSGVAINVSALYSSCSFDPYTSGNNGNVFQIFNNNDSTRSVAYLYDSLNRVSQANTVNNPSSNCWGEAYQIDAWGNLTNIASPSFMQGQGWNCNTESLNAASANTQNQLTGVSYDIAGNVVNDGNGNQPTYDAENEVDTDAGVTYDYDADGVRTEKSSGTMYWPGPFGTLTETDLSGNIHEEYIYFNGARIARVDRPSGTLHYYFSNHLGSASVITDASGNIEEQMDFYPYGGIAYVSGSDPNNYKFTGKERDTESGLDMFGARYYGSSLGRFMTPDPAGMMAVDIGSPQTLNRYAYVLNNPLSFIDPLGLDCVYLNSGGTGVEKGGVDQSSSSGECGTTGGYWVNGSVTNVSIGGDAQTISLTGTNNGSDTTSGSYQQDATVTVGEYNNLSAQTYNHIALGLLGQPQLGQNPRSDAHYLWALSMHGPTATVPGKIKPQVGGKLLRMARIRATGMQAQILQNAMNQSAQNPPPYSVFGQTGCDCGTWAQQMLGDAGINSGPPAPLPDNLMDQLNQIYPQQPPQ